MALTLQRTLKPLSGLRHTVSAAFLLQSGACAVVAWSVLHGGITIPPPPPPAPPPTGQAPRAVGPPRPVGAPAGPGAAARAPRRSRSFSPPLAPGPRLPRTRPPPSAPA